MGRYFFEPLSKKEKLERYSKLQNEYSRYADGFKKSNDSFNAQKNQEKADFYEFEIKRLNNQN